MFHAFSRLHLLLPAALLLLSTHAQALMLQPGDSASLYFDIDSLSSGPGPIPVPTAMPTVPGSYVAYFSNILATASDGYGAGDEMQLNLHLNGIAAAITNVISFSDPEGFDPGSWQFSFFATALENFSGYLEIVMLSGSVELDSSNTAELRFYTDAPGAIGPIYLDIPDAPTPAPVPGIAWLMLPGLLWMTRMVRHKR